MTLRLCNVKQQQAKQCKKLKVFRKIFFICLHNGNGSWKKPRGLDKNNSHVTVDLHLLDTRIKARFNGVCAECFVLF